MSQELANTRQAATSEPTAEQIATFRAALARKYDGVSDRELLELAAHNSETTARTIAQVAASVGPAMEQLSKGGIMGLLGMGKR